MLEGARTRRRRHPAELADVAAARRRSTTWPAASGRCARATAPPTTTGTEAPTRPTRPPLFEQMEREVKTYGIDSWKWYCHTDPGRSGNGFKLDDEKLTYPFYEKSKKLGMKIFSVHKGYASQSRTLGHLANPADVEKAAPRPPRPDVHHLPLGPEARPGRAAVQGEGLLRPDDRRLRLARRADEDQGAQPEDEQRLSGDRLVVRQPGDRSTR